MGEHVESGETSVSMIGNESWISVPIVLSMFVSVSGIAYFMAEISARSTSNKEAITILEQQVNDIHQTTSGNSAKLDILIDLKTQQLKQSN